MQRRALLLFTLFVVTAWFYAGMADHSSEMVVNEHVKQVEMLENADEVLSGTAESAAGQDQG